MKCWVAQNLPSLFLKSFEEFLKGPGIWILFILVHTHIHMDLPKHTNFVAGVSSIYFLKHQIIFFEGSTIIIN